MLPRKPLDHRGVSEVLGTILVLLITVIIFSTIILWVFTLPTPSAGVSVTFDGLLSGNYVGGIWDGASVNLTHLGGEDLYEGSTRVYLTVDNKTEVLKTQGTFFDGVSVKEYGVEGPDATWNIGEVWSYLNESIPQNAIVSVLVVDLVRGVVLWDETLFGAPGDRAPIFLDKWVDPLPSTPTRDRVEPQDKFTVYAKVFDPDLDLNNRSVWAYLTFGLNGTPLGYVQLLDDGSASVGDRLAGDGIFSRALNYKAQKGWDGGIILLNATDLDGHTRATRLILNVGRGSGGFGNPFGGTWNSTLGGIGQGDSGPLGDQGWNIYDEEGLPTADNQAGTPTRTFQPGETVYVIARSTVIQNVENINSFVLRDATGVKLYPPTKEFDSRDPTKTDPAFTQTLTSPYFEYEYSFAAPTTDGTYSVELTLKDNAGHTFLFGTDTIWVSTGGAPPAYPKIVTYRDPNKDGELSDLVEATRFNTTDLLYVRVFFEDLDLDLATCDQWFSTTTCPIEVNANAGDVEVLDYYGATPVKKRPGNSPVSKLSTFAYDQPGENSYVFYIDLLRRVQDPWLPGTNFYTLRIRTIIDFGYASTTAESYQMLSRQVEVIAPLSTIDIVGATEAGGGERGRGVYWYEKSFDWQEHEINVLPKDAKKPLAMATGDLNGDTKIDVVIGLDADEITNIIAYFNLDYGTTWRREFINQFQGDDNYRAESLAIADLDGDGDGDLLAGVRDSADTGVGAIIFWNDGSWSTQVLQYSETGTPPPMRSIAIGDINNDGRLDVVSGDKDGLVNYYCNNVRGSFLAGSTTPCPGKISLEPPGDGGSFNQGVLVGQDSQIQYNSLELGRMEGLADDDTTLDIVVSNDQDLIIYRNSLSGGVPSFTKYDVVENGDQISRRIQSLAVGDMNNDGMLDIVVGIEPAAREDGGVYRLRNMGMTAGPSPNFNPWDSNELPHTVTNPKDGQIAELRKVKDIELGDTDNDGDLDIVFISDVKDDFLNNLWHYENIGDDPTTYIETTIFTDGWFKRKEKAFAVELTYIDL